MAIHAIVSSSAWDEQIVPALRKRLESESRTLSRRMSAVSITSTEDSQGPTFSSNAHSILRGPTASPTLSQKGSAIPRPSLQQSQNSTEGPSRVYTNGIPSSVSKSLPFNRSRTYSQPYTYDVHRNGTNGSQRYTAANGSPMTPESSGSTLPMYVSRTSDVKPTRIPKVAPGRSSTSSYNRPHSNMSVVMSSEGHGSSYGPYTPETSPDLWRLKEAAQSNRSRSTVSVASHTQHQHTLMHEPAPFPPSSAAQSYDHSQSQEDAPRRPSIDSEERPFEHWYRGEVSRNGGVGELRVGKRMEMLDIANYGHTLRKAHVPSNPRGVAISEDTAKRRNRSNSVTGAGERESLYLDEDRVNGEQRVLDETPLTDLEVDSESEHDIPEYYSTDLNGNDDTITSQDLRSVTPSSYRSSSRVAQNGTTPSRIPAPTPRQSSEPPRTITPTPPSRGASEPPSFPPTPSSSRTQQQPPGVPRSASQPGQSQTEKRRAKSPAAGSTSASKRTKTSLTQAKKLRDQEANRRSVAYYPAPAGGDGDIMDAIPSWTQPVPSSGNWDEVVLPVVARKKGLDGQYEKADGGPRPLKPHRVEPAPGTFGFDYSKYRPSVNDNERIPMDEFGRQPIDETVQEEDVQDSDEKEHRTHEDKSSPIYLPAPPPPLQHRAGPEVPTMTLNGGGALKGHQREDEDEKGGCCGCVIM